jgi:SAM-dependent methyltransferase
MDEHLRIEFNEWARAGRGEGMERGHRPVGEQAIEKMNIPRNARILDVGCGSGWASRLMAEKAVEGKVVGIDISDAMVRLSADTSTEFSNVEFKVASAEALPFADSEFSHAFSMESLYYYTNMSTAVGEIYRVIGDGGAFFNVVDLYLENAPSHQWVSTLKVPVQLLSEADYRELFEGAGFVNVKLERVRDPRPVPEDYSSGSFNTREDYVLYRQNGSLMVSGEVRK